MLSKFLTIVILLSTGLIANADLEWSGVYRFEAMTFDKTSFLDDGSKKEYATHHLVLKPKITVADGFEVNARFDALNGATDQTVHPNNQIGSSLGSSPSNNDQYYSSRAGNAGADTVEITQAYLTYNHNFGALIVGRAPVHFGLGMTFDAGDGLFDHWYDTRDMVGYKVHFGNMFIFPMYGKVNEGPIGQSSSDMEDLMLQAEYLNPDTDMRIGFFISEKKSKAGEHDFSDQFGGATIYNRNSKLKLRTMNFYLKKEMERFKYAFEFSYLSGDTGLTLGGKDVGIQGFGAAAELDYAMPDHSMDIGLKFGYASGDDKTTLDEVEAYIFNRNYDVGMLLMNHPVGDKDLLGVQSFVRKGFNSSLPGANDSRLDDYDVEAISNVMYFAPHMKYHLNDKWKLGATFVTAFLLEDAENLIDMDKSLGYELDLSIEYQPIERVNLLLEAAALLPGSAYETGGVDSKFTYGLMGKAAVSF